MIHILFICHGNICRSPMAEFILRDMLEQTGKEGEIAVSSAAVSREELGNPVYPPVERLLREHGMSENADSRTLPGKAITTADIAAF